MAAPRVSELVERCAEQVRAGGRRDIADELIRRLDVTPSGVPIVLVAGEDKRGKSSLVNALLGRRDLSPVGVEVVTGAPITFYKADPERAAIVRYGQSKEQEVDFQAARQLATVQGNPGNEQNIRAVRLGIPCALLDKVTIVDTPGVGGLDSGHGELTLQSLQFAQALVFVMEAGSQFGAGELDFLKKAATRIDTVVLVLTKIDLNRGWRTVLDDNLAILREKAPRFVGCPVVPVSSRLALRGLQTDDPQEAEALREESGIARLESVLGERVVERAAVLHDANLLRGTIWPLSMSERSLREQLALVTQGGAAREILDAEWERLATLGDDRAEWPALLEREIRKLTLQRNEDLTIGLATVRRKYEERLKAEKKEDREGLPGELLADLTALAGRLNEQAARQLSHMLDEMIEDIDPKGSLQTSIDRATDHDLDEQLALLGIGDYKLDRFGKLTLMSSFASGHSISTILSGAGLGIGTGAFLFPPIGIAIGIGLGAFFAFESFRSKKGSLFAMEFRGWMGEQCNQVQSVVTTTFQREVIDVQDEMYRAVRAALEEREREIGDSIQSAEKLLADEDAGRADAEQDLGRRLASIEELRRSVLTMLRSLRTAKSLEELDGVDPVGPS